MQGQKQGLPNLIEGNKHKNQPRKDNTNSFVTSQHTNIKTQQYTTGGKATSCACQTPQKEILILFWLSPAGKVTLTNMFG